MKQGTERNKSNYLQAKQAFNNRDIEGCIAFYSVGHQIRSRPSPPGRAGIEAFFRGTQATWPDISIEVEHVVAEGDWVMGRSLVTATHSTAAYGLAPTHRPVRTTFWDLHRFDDDGLIAESWNLMDGLAVMTELGLLPKPT